MNLEMTRPDLIWRYQNDAIFNRVVDMMTSVMLDHGITADDLSSAALVAADKVDYIQVRRRNAPPYIPPS